MSFVVIIPARYASTRLPGKPLVDINGKPMIVHVLERARESGAERIIVATDHEDVARAVEAAGGEVCMTRADHQSGTERLAEDLLWSYLQRAPVAESFIWRRWLYVLWDEVAQLVNTGRFSRRNFDLASKSLLPWLA